METLEQLSNLKMEQLRNSSQKEILTTLRTVLGIMIAVILTITAGLIKQYNADRIDNLFFAGGFIDFVLVLSLPVIVHYIIKNIKLLEEL